MFTTLYLDYYFIIYLFNFYWGDERKRTRTNHHHQDAALDDVALDEDAVRGGRKTTCFMVSLLMEVDRSNQTNVDITKMRRNWTIN